MFKLSGFADEIDTDLMNQIRALNAMSMKYIEVRGVNGKNVAELTLPEAYWVKERLDDAGIHVSAVGSPIGKVDIDAPFEQELKRFSHIVKVAEIFDAPFIRIFSFYIPKGKNPDDYADLVVERLSEFVRMIKDHDITLAHENESGIFGDSPARNLLIAERIKDPKLRLVYDAGNYICCGYEPYPAALESLLPYIAYLHIKDAKPGGDIVPAGLGAARYPEIIKRLRENGKEFFLSVEPHLQAFDGLDQLVKSDNHILAKSGVREKQPGEVMFRVALDALNGILTGGA